MHAFNSPTMLTLSHNSEIPGQNHNQCKSDDSLQALHNLINEYYFEWITI